MAGEYGKKIHFLADTLAGEIGKLNEWKDDVESEDLELRGRVGAMDSILQELHVDFRVFEARNQRSEGQREKPEKATP